MGQQKNSRNPFEFKQFVVHQNQVALPVTTDACLFGAWIQLNQNDESLTVLDVGTGTGLLMFMLAQKYPSHQYIGIDIHGDSIIQATQSLKLWTVQGHPTSMRFEICDFLDFNHPKVDTIVCNPPFFNLQLESPDPTRNKARHSKNLTRHKLIKQSFELLNTHGKLFLMLPFDGHKQVFIDLRNQGFTITRTTSVSANANKSPHLIFIESLKTDAPIPLNERRDSPTIQQLIAYNLPGELNSNPYNLTTESSDLLKDYYIKL